MSSIDLSPNESLLKWLASEPFLFCPNPGNAGDSAIACATFLAFDRYGCEYEVVDSETPVSRTQNKIVVYGGGGNLVGYYPNARNFIERHHEKAKRFVLLPHTVDGHEELLSQLTSNSYIFCREYRSLTHVKLMAKRANVNFAHDMAFLLRPELDFPKSYPAISKNPLKSATRSRTTKRQLRILGHNFKNIGNPGELHAFRTDAEKTSIVIPWTNIDVSQAFAADSMSKADSFDATWALLDFLAKFDVVSTNRLHVSILSALLGKSVRLFDNSYGKNTNVYSASMRGHFPKVSLVEQK